ncbi:MAG: multicopper oxidase family protein [Actinomycetales bacterium]|nr:multicopper oxidase family protein [Actinomycetales bacterium]
MSKDISRRQALALGLAGAGSLAVGVAGLGARGWPPSGTPSTNRTEGPSATWAEPAVLTSAQGVLDVELRLAPTQVQIGDQMATMLTYNGTVPGPTLHLRPGDLLRVHLVNDLDEATNLHTHGLLVSPAGNSDNPFVRVGPGESFDYAIELPDDHPQGIFWYHPHHHGLVADQVFAGLYGAIVVDDADWTASPPRVVVVSDTTISSGRVAQASGMDRMQGRTGRTVLTNGLISPALTAPEGSTQRLLVINACTSRYLDLEHVGHQLRLYGLDSGALSPPPTRTRVVLPPGGRADLGVEVPAGSTTLLAHAYDRGAAGMGMMGGGSLAGSDATILTLTTGGDQVSSAPSAARSAPTDLRDAEVTRSRTLTFSMGMGGMQGMQFLIDGQAFDPERVDQQVRLGTVEEWTIRNSTMMNHPFHLHVWPMQVVETSGARVDAVEVRDVVDVPPGGQTVVRVAFSRYAGSTVYHCHILDHEDLGMMGVIAAQ